MGIKTRALTKNGETVLVSDTAQATRLLAAGWSALPGLLPTPKPIDALPNAAAGLSSTLTGLSSTVSGLAARPTIAGKANQNYKMLLGTIRNVGSAGGYWQPVSDTAHKPSNISSITTSATEIVVSYGFSGTAIGTVIAVPDETMASEGFFMGSSVASNECRIRLGRRKVVGDYVYWDATLNAGAGGFRSANNVFTVTSYTAGVLTLTHPFVFGAQQNNARVASRGGAYRPVISTSGSPLLETTTKVELWTAAGALATAGHADMKFYVERYDVTGFLDPRTAIDTTSAPNHNIWLYGIHENGAIA